MLTTISRHVTKPYKKSKLEAQTKKDIATIHLGLEKLQKMIVKLRGFTEIQQTLGTALHVPAVTRWVSVLEMVDHFFRSKTDILDVVKEKKPDLHSDVVKLYTDYEEAFKDYQKVVEPIRKRIVNLEVFFILHFFIIF